MMRYKRGQQVVVETYGRYEIQTVTDEETGKVSEQKVYIPKYQIGTVEDVRPDKIITYHLKMESGKELMAWNSTKQLPRIKSLFHEGNVI